jgi:hypothetical protein
LDPWLPSCKSASINCCSESSAWFLELMDARTAFPGDDNDGGLGADEWIGRGIAAVEAAVEGLYLLGRAAKHAAPDLLCGDLGQEPPKPSPLADRSTGTCISSDRLRFAGCGQRSFGLVRLR